MRQRRLPARCVGQDLGETLGRQEAGVSLAGPVTGTSTRLVLARPAAVHDVRSTAVLLTD